MSRARAAALCALNHSQSQYHEDLILLPTLLRLARGRPGVFVELGALDGVMYSNTLMLERCFGWTGVLIEANPTSFESLQRAGRRATLVHSAVCNLKRGDTQGTVRVFHGGKEISGEADSVSSKMRSFIAPNERVTVDVPCRPLAAIMATAGYGAADFLSLDVEGAEAKVLQTVSPAAFALICVELDGRAPAKDALARELMQNSTPPMRPATEIAVLKSHIFVREGERQLRWMPKHNVRFGGIWQPDPIAARNVTALANAIHAALTDSRPNSAG